MKAPINTLRFEKRRGAGINQKERLVLREKEKNKEEEERGGAPSLE